MVKAEAELVDASSDLIAGASRRVRIHVLSTPENT